MPKPIYVRAFIAGYDTSQTGGFDPDDGTVSVYFPYTQYENKTNNFDLNRLKKTLMHELAHAVDYMNSYYTTKARRVIPSTIPEKDRKVINKVNPYIYDILYRLWNDSEMNAQQITITEDLISSIKEGIEALKSLDPRHEVFSILRQVVPTTRENISDTRFKVWFISNSEKRLNKLISKKNKNDARLSN